MKKTETLSAQELERKFDAGEEILDYFDLDKPIKPNKMQRLTLDLPSWTVTALDTEAVRIGITRQSLIKTLIDVGLRSAGHSNAPKNGKRVAKLTSARQDKRACAKALFGILHGDADLDSAQKKRLT